MSERAPTITYCQSIGSVAIYDPSGDNFANINIRSTLGVRMLAQCIAQCRTLFGPTLVEDWQIDETITDYLSDYAVYPKSKVEPEIEILRVVD